MEPPSAKVRPVDDPKRASYNYCRTAAVTAPRACGCSSANVRTHPSCAAAVGGLFVHGSVHWKRGARSLALFCVIGLSLTRAARPYAPSGSFGTRRSSDSSRNTVQDFTFCCAAAASEPPSMQPEAKASGPPEPTPDASNPLARLNLPEGVLQGLQSVDWSTFLSMAGAGIEIALSEGRKFAKELMQSERLQHLLRTLDVEKVEDGLESLVENLGFKEKLLVQLRRERRTLEMSFVPIFYFARERVLKRSREDDEAALKIALEDHLLKAVVKRFENVPPARNMSSAPTTLDAMHENLSSVVAIFMRSRPVALSLALRVELLTREFVDYCQAVFSALTRYITFVNRFHKNRRALFFFAQRTLPRVLNILLLLNRLEEFLLQRARSEFAENSHQPGALRKAARRLATHTTGLVSYLECIAHACLAATSSQFQVDFGVALSNYDHGEDALTAFKAFLETPSDLRQEDQQHPEQRQQEDNASGKSLQQSQSQSSKQHERRRISDVLPDRRGKAGSYVNKQSNDEASGREDKQHGLSELEAADYTEVLRLHLNELQRLRATYTSKANDSLYVSQAPLAGVGDILLGDHNEAPRKPFQSSGVPADAGALLAGLPLQTFVASSPRLFFDTRTVTGDAKLTPMNSVDSAPVVEPAFDAFAASAPIPNGNAVVDAAANISTEAGWDRRMTDGDKGN